MALGSHVTRPNLRTRPRASACPASLTHEIFSRGLAALSISFFFFFFFFLIMGPPPKSTLFPYTTLFRSHRPARDLERPRHAGQERKRIARLLLTDRSEEHTSELQSLRHLVCRLLLEN